MINSEMYNFSDTVNDELQNEILAREEYEKVSIRPQDFIFLSARPCPRKGEWGRGRVLDYFS